ncbi:energy-coupling factor transporter transmembrane component T family protein [Antrihabitans cavernicola]|uniref:Energy-coupling factor transporter transmembrane protein EcfT n=1 Tax=Antrihabitans cavernicola TaxID=2495913 RepID=A0A5A7S8B9_9NOCA|nr:energy-coupling factor transporter transmembrane protein EcfT [Spelaeibacter cavernicola]KAA0021167.1 energy-coupling factor transporter transmembrane protein EcfT [Spelaeibacter cavernicola]
MSSTVLLRRVPGDSVIHRLWAGTKLIAIFAISLVLLAVPTWPVIAGLAAVLIATGIIARIPLGALPRLPWWFWALAVGGGLVNITISGQAVLQYVRLIVLGLLLLASSMLIAWTTSLNQIAPAIATLGRPLKRIGLPIDEWAVAVALSLRSLPLLIEEMRLLRAARRLRPKGGPAHHSANDNGLIDIITAAMSVAMRRAGELGEAITARGGTGQLAAYPSKPGLRDAVALAIIVAFSVASVWLTVAL